MNTTTAVSACLLITACSGPAPASKATGARASTPALPALQTPAAEDVLQFTADPQPKRSHFPDFTIDSAQIASILTTWHAVSEDEWRHNYHHVALEDRTGTITLRDGTTLRWMVRPGGLAMLSLPEHRTAFLAKERRRKEGE
jgi:hypothetical protein